MVYFIIVLVIYYASVIGETFSEKYYGSPITTKKDFFLSLIPFFMWLKVFIFAFKDLD